MREKSPDTFIYPKKDDVNYYKPQQIEQIINDESGRDTDDRPVIEKEYSSREESPTYDELIDHTHHTKERGPKVGRGE